MFYLVRRKKLQALDDSISLELLAESPIYERIEHLYDSYRNVGHYHLLVLHELDMYRRERDEPVVHMTHTKDDEPEEESHGMDWVPDLEPDHQYDNIIPPEPELTVGDGKPDLDAYTEEVFKPKEDKRLKSQ